MKQVPVWLADDTTSGIFTYWVNLSKFLGRDEIVFVSDAETTLDPERPELISVETFRENHRDFTLPLMNLGVSRYYTKQLEFLFEHSGFLFFHQLYLHRLIENYYIRNGTRRAEDYEIYAQAEADKFGGLLARLGAKNGLSTNEMYLRTFAKRLVAESVGYCSSWKGAQKRLTEEGLSRRDNKRFVFVPPFYEVDEAALAARQQRANSDELTFALLGHKSELKNPYFCWQIILELARLGMPVKLVTIGTIGEMVSAYADADTEHLLKIYDAPTHPDFLAALREVDFVLHFRHPFGGEMSATVCEAMSQGAIPVGYYKDWLEDLPRRVCVGLDYTTDPLEAARQIMQTVSDRGAVKKLHTRLTQFLEAQQGATLVTDSLQSIFTHLRDLDSRT